MKKYLFLLLTIFVSNILLSQNELYIKGNDGTNPTLYVKGNVADPAKPTLYVKGEIINKDGIFYNADGRIELTGDWTNDVAGANAKYESTGEEKFVGTADQKLKKTDAGIGWAGTGATNQLYNTKFNNTTSITLSTNVNNHVNGSTSFGADNVVITGANRYYVQSTDPTDLNGYGAVGDRKKFFLGNLWRETATGNSYDLPVGYSKATSGAFGEGIQLATVKVNSGSGTLESKFENTGTFSPVPITICAGAPTPEARDVDAILNNGFWTVSNGGSITDFDMTLAPADYTALSNPGDYTIIQNGAATGADDCTGALTGLPITHGGLSSFSKWEIGGSTDGSPLPVELISLNAEGIDNKYIQVSWETATEINNEGFEVQRSLDGTNFEAIGFVQGNGNSVNKHDYIFNDKNVKASIVYYYRLKQVDFDGNFELTYKVNASLDSKNEDIFVSPFIPNPSTAYSHIEVQVPNETNANMIMYNAIGKRIVSKSFTLNKGLNVIPFDIQLLSSGLYHTTIVIGDKSFTRKLEIIK